MLGGEGESGGRGAFAVLGTGGFADAFARGGGIPGVAAAGAFDELHDPFTGNEGGIERREKSDDGAFDVGIDAFGGVEHAIAHGDDGVARGGFEIGRGANAEDVIEDGFDGTGVDGEDGCRGEELGEEGRERRRGEDEVGAEGSDAGEVGG